MMQPSALGPAQLAQQPTLLPQCRHESAFTPQPNKHLVFTIVVTPPLPAWPAALVTKLVRVVATMLVGMLGVRLCAAVILGNFMSNLRASRSLRRLHYGML
jgi:hypothetical protein